MEATDLTIEILRSIRDEVKSVRDEVKGTNSRIDVLGDAVKQTNLRIDDTNSRLDVVSRRIVESEIRTFTAIADLAGTVREMTSVLRAQVHLRPRVERCEHEIEALKQAHGR